MNEGEVQKDCLQCKIIGSGTMFGLSGYMNMIRMQSKNPRHQLFYLTISVGIYAFLYSLERYCRFLLVTSVGTAAAGIYRWFI